MGLGEALVGNFPGRAMSFYGTSNNLENVTIKTYPSKIERLINPSDEPNYIARSDSNGEDLEGFAGAGLYSSIPRHPYTSHAIEYVSEPLVWDSNYQKELLSQILSLGSSIEKACGGQPQDVEGVVTPDGTIYVVQTRPQNAP